MPCPLPAATLIRSAALEQVGGFATDLYNGVSIDWSARLMEARLTTTMLPDVLYERRLHKTNVTLSARDESGAFLRIVKSSLDRRRVAEDR